MGKKVSIMMPVYNGLPLIKASIESILRQTYSNWECIIVDDGSTDGTSEYLDMLPQLDSRFIIHHFEKNMGRPYARQKTLELSTGEYVTMLDADDLMSPDRIEVQVQYLENNPDCVLVSSAMLSYGSQTDLLCVRGPKQVEILTYDGKKRPNHASSMMKGDRARMYRYNPLQKFGEDQEFLRRYLKEQKFILLPDILYYYSEFDSVTKKKIKQTYIFSMKRSFMDGKFHMFIECLFKLIYSNIVFPFIPVEKILLRRGYQPNEVQVDSYKRDCQSIIRKYIGMVTI